MSDYKKKVIVDSMSMEEILQILAEDGKFLQHKIVEKSLILCEIEYRQRELALQAASAFFPEYKIEVLNDLAGQPRLLEIKEQGSRK